MELAEEVPCEGAADVVLAVCLLDVLEVPWVVDDVEAGVRHGDLVGWAVALVQREPGLAACGAFRLEVLGVALEGLTLGLWYPVAVGGRRGQDASVAVGPAESYPRQSAAVHTSCFTQPS